MIINKKKTYKAILAILLTAVIGVALAFSIIGLRQKSNYLDNSSNLKRVQSTYKLDKNNVSKSELNELSKSLVKRANVYPNVYNDIKTFYDLDEKTVTLEYSTSLDENITTFALQGSGDVTLEVNSPSDGQPNIIVAPESIVYDSIRTNSTSAFLDYTNGASNPYSVSFKVKDPINFKDARLGEELQTNQQDQQQEQEKPKRSINVWRDRNSFIRSVHSFWYDINQKINSNEYKEAADEDKTSIVSKEVLDDFNLIKTVFQDNGISPTDFNSPTLDKTLLDNLSRYPIIWPAILRATRTFSNASALYVVTSFIPDAKLINQDKALEVVFSIQNPGATRNFFETIASFRNNNLSSSVSTVSYKKLDDSVKSSLTKESLNYSNSSYVILALILVISLGFFAIAIIRFKLQSIIYTLALTFSIIIPSLVLSSIGFPITLMSLVGIIIGSIIPIFLFSSYGKSYKKDFKSSKNYSFSNSNNYLKVFLRYFDSIVISLAISISLYLFSSSILVKQASLFFFSLTIISSLIYWFIPVLTLAYNYLIPWFSRDFLSFSKAEKIINKISMIHIRNKVLRISSLTLPVAIMLLSLVLMFTLGYSNNSLVYTSPEISFNSFFFNFFSESLLGSSVAIGFSFLFLSVRKGILKSLIFSFWSIFLVVSLFTIYSILRIELDENSLALISVMAAVSPVFFLQTKAFGHSSNFSASYLVALFLPLSLLFISINFIPLVISSSIIVIWIVSYISSSSITYITQKSKSSKLLSRLNTSIHKNRDKIDEQTIPMINS